MKKYIVSFVLISMPLCALIAQGNYAFLNNLKYINVTSFQSATFNIEKLDDFISLVQDNVNKGNNNIFRYNDSFIVTTSGGSYIIRSNKYETLSDYKDGEDRHFKDGASYTYARDNKLDNQDEVDYFKNEGFYTVEDYRDAQRLDIVNNPDIKSGGYFYGLIKNSELEKKKNSLYVKLAYFIYNNKGANMRERYKNFNEDNNDYKSRNRRSGSAFIKALTNFDDYSLVNISFLTSKDASFYYAFKLSGYSSLSECMEDRKNNYENRYPVKGTPDIVSIHKFYTIQDMLNADKHGIKNGADYGLITAYRISPEQLKEHRRLIDRLEDIKVRFLRNYENDETYDAGNENISGL